MAHQHEGHDHGHAPIAFDRTKVSPEALRALDGPHPALAEGLSLSARYPELSDEERKDVVRLHERMVDEGPWLVGFHAEGDACAVCGQPTEALFEDALGNGAVLPWAAFASDLPAHPSCMEGFAAKYPRMSPRVLDQARRQTMRDLDRPSAQMASFFRHDLLEHREFDLEDWANSVAEANEGNLTRAAARDIEKLLHWVHERVFHAHE